MTDWTPKQISHVLEDCATYLRTLYKQHNISTMQQGIDPDRLEAAARVAATPTKRDAHRAKMRRKQERDERAGKYDGEPLRMRPDGTYFKPGN